MKDIKNISNKENYLNEHLYLKTDLPKRQVRPLFIEYCFHTLHTSPIMVLQNLPILTRSNTGFLFKNTHKVLNS